MIRNHGYFLTGLWVMALVSAVHATPKRVLLCYSVGCDLEPVNMAGPTCKTTLANALGEPVDVLEVSLRMTRFGDLKMEAATANLGFSWFGHSAIRLNSRPVL